MGTSCGRGLLAALLLGESTGIVSPFEAEPVSSRPLLGRLREEQPWEVLVGGLRQPWERIGPRKRGVGLGGVGRMEGNEKK